MMTLAEEYGQTDVLVVGLVIYGLFGFLADSAVRLTERKALAWRRTLEG
jgi:sulfonate transport system permease protein